MKIALTAALAAATLFAGAANAALINGTFTVTAVNVTNVNSSESQATLANFDAALAGTLGDGGTNPASVYASDIFTYTGDLDFGTSNGNSTTISQWLASGTTGGVTEGAMDDTLLDATFGGLTNSSSSINNGTATTTFYMFELTSAGLGASDLAIRHDDGVAVYEDGVLIGGTLGPTSVTNTAVDGFGGGDFKLLYVATNNDPSILEVEATPIPLPAGLPLLAAGLGGLMVLRRRRAKS